jgi:hypothetical protein
LPFFSAFASQEEESQEACDSTVIGEMMDLRGLEAYHLSRAWLNSWASAPDSYLASILAAHRVRAPAAARELFLSTLVEVFLVFL